VQKQLGHATASITLDVYGHLSPTSWSKLAEEVGFEAASALLRWRRSWACRCGDLRIVAYRP
jgi:hypothetical protein